MPLKSQATAEILDPTPKTLGHEPPTFGVMAWDWSRRPPFSLWAAEQMLLDEQVLFGLAIGNSPLYAAEITVTGDSDVAEFVQDQFSRLWALEAQKILRTKRFGYMGFEVMYRRDDSNRIVFDSLRDLHPRHVRPLLVQGEFVGLRAHQIKSTGPQDRRNGKADLLGMKGLWLTYEAEYGRLFGRALLEGAYPRWWDKNTEGGAGDLVRVRMMKDAWIGDQIYFDKDEVIRTPDGQTISARDLAREVMGLRSSGGCLALPMKQGPTGPQKILEYEPPSSVQGATQLLEWVQSLDKGILSGLLVPAEVVEAAQTGSGFSGRSIPFAAFLSVRDAEFSCHVREIKQQMLDRLVAANFSPAAAKSYDVTPVPLMKSVGKLLGDFGQPNMQSDSGGQLAELIGQRLGGEDGDDEEDAAQFSTASDSPGSPKRTTPILSQAITASEALAGDIRRRLGRLLKKAERA